MTGKYLIRKTNMLYAEMRVPKDVRHLFNQAKFSQTLKTDSFEIAEERKLSVISNWKAMIRAARQTIKPEQFDFDKAVKSYSETFKALGGGEEARTHISHQVPLKEAETEKEMAEINEEHLIAQGAAIGAGLATSIYLEEWLSRC